MIIRALLLFCLSPTYFARRRPLLSIYSYLIILVIHVNNYAELKKIQKKLRERVLRLRMNQMNFKETMFFSLVCQRKTQ